MAKWDVFRVRDFDQTFGIEEQEVRRMLAAGELRDDDCVRKSGDEKWIRIAAIPKFKQIRESGNPSPPVHRVRFQRPDETPEPKQKPKDRAPKHKEPATPPEATPEEQYSLKPLEETPPPAPESPAPPRNAYETLANRLVDEQEDEWDDNGWDNERMPPRSWAPDEPVEAEKNVPAGHWDADSMPPEDEEFEAETWKSDQSSEEDERVASSPVGDFEAEPEVRPVIQTESAQHEEDDEEEDEGFFAIGKRRTQVEELDLTAMVDVTFLLVLFFMITATYTLQESINVPAPDPEQKKAQQAIQSLDDLREDYIVVTINADNTLEVDGELVRPEFDALVNRIRRINRESARNELVIYANGAAFHETVVLVYDAANEVGMQRIRLAADADG